MQVAVSRKEEGLRERKRRETLQRISEVGLRLFMAKGYDATTLDEIAAEAGISRRTFFYYFESKDDIILAYVGVFAEALKTAVKESAASNTPLDRVQDAVTKVFGRIETSKLLTIVRFMGESMTLGVKRRKDLQFEQAIFETLCEIWPAKNRRTRLRLVTMASIGATRVAVGAWREQNGKRPLASYIREAFNDLRAEIGAKE
jgi:AcrR family transcriptional regulator